MGIKGILNGLNGLFSAEEEEDESFDEVEAVETNEEPKKEKVKVEEKTMAYTENKNETPRTAPKATGGAIELKVVRPESFNSVGQIADYLLNRCTVVLNLEATSKEVANRIVDFLNGVSYSIDGQIKAVANNTFIITPSNVAVSGEMLTGEKSQQKSNVRDSFDNF